MNIKYKNSLLYVVAFIHFAGILFFSKFIELRDLEFSEESLSIIVPTIFKQKFKVLFLFLSYLGVSYLHKILKSGYLIQFLKIYGNLNLTLLIAKKGAVLTALAILPIFLIQPIISELPLSLVLSFERFIGLILSFVLSYYFTLFLYVLSRDIKIAAATYFISIIAELGLYKLNNSITYFPNSVIVSLRTSLDVQNLIFCGIYIALFIFSVHKLIEINKNKIVMDIDSN